MLVSPLRGLGRKFLPMTCCGLPRSCRLLGRARPPFPRPGSPPARRRRTVARAVPAQPGRQTHDAGAQPPRVRYTTRAARRRRRCGLLMLRQRRRRGPGLGVIFHDAILSGWFQGVMSSTTPTGPRGTQGLFFRRGIGPWVTGWPAAESASSPWRRGQPSARHR